MTGQIVNTTGIHVSGDFQTIAGFPGGDWASNTTTLTQEGATDIYSIVVDIPAFAKYEYKFLNGDQFYEAEFVPVESRVGYNFNDNRWIYVDSLGDDTTFVGAILFAANAPANLNLVRFSVNTQGMTALDPAGMHVAGSFQSFNPSQIFLYSFVQDVSEIIAYLPLGSYEYKYYDGNTIAGTETVPGVCAVNGNRGLDVTKDTVLTTYCFSTCNSCLVNVEETALQNVSLYPNPTTGAAELKFEDRSLDYAISITDLTGRLVKSIELKNEISAKIDLSSWSKGLYFVNAHASNNKSFSGKLIVQ